MDWYGNGVSCAIQEAFSQKKIFLVYIEDDSEDSINMAKTWEAKEVQNCVQENCVSVKVHASREDGKQFATFYPVLMVPSTYLINSSGVPVDIIPGFVDPAKFLERLNGTFKKGEQDATSVPDGSSTAFEVSEKETTIEGTTLSRESEADIPPAYDNSSSSVEDRTRKAEELMQRRREVRAKQEEENDKEKEFKRRREGQELSQARRDQAERQAATLANEIAQRKAEEKAAREAVREQIRRDRAEKAARFNAEGEARLRERAKKAQELAAEAATVPEPSVCRLQFRYPDGSNATQTFNPETRLGTVTLSAVELSDGRYPQLRLVSIYPKHEYTEDEMSKTVRDLGLMPSAALVVIPGRVKQTQQVATSGNFLIDLFWAILAPLLWLLAWLKSTFVSSTNTAQTSGSAHEQSVNDSRTFRLSQSTKSSSNVQAYKRHGNVHKFTQDDSDEDDDDENKTWNGNSTQQM